MTIVLIIILVLILLNTVAFLIERTRTHREIRQLKSTGYDLNDSLYRTKSRIEEVNIGIYESLNDLIHKQKRLDEMFTGIEMTLENVSSCHPSSLVFDNHPNITRRTYTEAEREQAVAYYEQHKAEGISKTQAAKTLGIPVSTYKSWFD